MRCDYKYLSMLKGFPADLFTACGGGGLLREKFREEVPMGIVTEEVPREGGYC